MGLVFKYGQYSRAIEDSKEPNKLSMKENGKEISCTDKGDFIV